MTKVSKRSELIEIFCIIWYNINTQKIKLFFYLIKKRIGENEMLNKKEIYKKDIIDFINSDINLTQKINLCRFFGDFLFEINSDNNSNNLQITNTNCEEVVFKEKIKKIVNGANKKFEEILEHITDTEFGKNYSLKQLKKIIEKDKNRIFYLILENKVNGYIYGDYDRETGDISVIDFNYERNKNNLLIGDVIAIYSTYIESQIVPRTFLMVDKGRISGYTTFNVMLDKKFIDWFWDLKEKEPNKTDEELLNRTIINFSETNGIKNSLNKDLAFKLLRIVEENDFNVKYIDTNMEEIRTTMINFFIKLLINRFLEIQDIPLKWTDILDFVKQDIEIYEKEQEEIVKSSKIEEIFEEFNSYEYRYGLEEIYRLTKKDKNDVISTLKSLNIEKIRKI